METNETTTPSITKTGMILSNVMPDMSYFESRFDIMQNNYEEVQRTQENFREQLRDMKTDMDRRFTETHSIIQRNNDDFREQLRNIKLDMDRRFNETHNDMNRSFNETRTDMKERFAQVDKNFEQVNQRFEQVDKRFEQVDKRFEQVDKRFEQVDKRFEQVDKRLDLIISSIEKLGDKIDHRDERQRKFTLLMFSIALSVTGLSVVGVLIKILNII